ncbi:hypothetical protein JKG68_30530 [Microvirga aerilata]|uniref:DUF6894 domain-containing protein n=1 Tax=Microvirga aerilata TaxID=670292 RepID=A0A936ZJ98_9HYPH|nr:hypothetical protein [Microvirga aerilata]MBL0408222.1 hypothetical protein [Microvirga aerilata]
MPRYYLNFRNFSHSVHDDEGTEFANLYAAVQGAVRSAAEIGMGQLARGNSGGGVIAVLDERNEPVFTLTASMGIDWHITPLQLNSLTA